MGIREAQLEEVMRGRVKRGGRSRAPRAHGADGEGAHGAAPAHGAASSAADAPPPGGVTRRVPTADDSCPICMESLDSGGSLVWCREGCGNNVHRHCMLVWSKHRATAERAGAAAGGGLSCPMCRATWGEIGLPERDAHPRQTAAQRREQRLRELAEDEDTPHHVGASCSACRATPIVGMRFRCVVCEGYGLCSRCYAHTATHDQHSFEMLGRPGQRWVPADRETHQAAAAAALAALAGPGLPAADGAGADGTALGPAAGAPPGVPALGLDGGGTMHAQIARMPRVQMPTESATAAVGAAAAPASEDGGGAAARAGGRASPEAGGDGAAPSGSVARCAHCLRRARKQQWFKQLPCAHCVHEACVPDWLSAHRGLCPTCGAAALTAAVMSALPPARGSASAAPGGAAVAGGGAAPSIALADGALGLADHAPPFGPHAPPHAVAGRRRPAALGRSASVGRRAPAAGSATARSHVPGPGAGVDLGVTGCSLGGGGGGGGSLGPGGSLGVCAPHLGLSAGRCAGGAPARGRSHSAPFLAAPGGAPPPGAGRKPMARGAAPALGVGAHAGHVVEARAAGAPPPAGRVRPPAGPSRPARARQAAAAAARAHGAGAGGAMSGMGITALSAHL